MAECQSKSEKNLREDRKLRLSFLQFLPQICNRSAQPYSDVILFVIPRKFRQDLTQLEIIQCDLERKSNFKLEL